MINNRLHALVLSCASAVVLIVSGCSENAGNAAAIAETPPVRHLEAAVAAYAQSHGHGSGVGTPAGCNDRIIGERPTGRSSQQLYLELSCSSLRGHPPCPTRNSTAFWTAAVATVSTDSTVTALKIDGRDDAGWHRWITRQFPAQWRGVEDDGPRYGKLLSSRLKHQFPCS